MSAQIKPIRVMKDLPNYSDNQLAELEAAIAMEYQRRGKVLTISGYQEQIPLPGTNTAISMRQKETLKRRSRNLDITSGYREDWQIIQFADWAMKDREQEIEVILKNDLIPFMSYIASLQTTIARIAGIVQSPLKLWSEDEDGHKIYAFDEQDAGNITKYFTELLAAADRLEYTYEDIISPVPIAAGIVNLRNGHDKGESLRAAINQYMPFLDQTKKWIDHYKLSGAPKNALLDRICKRAKPYRDNGKDYTETLRQMMNDTENDPNAQDEYAKLEGWDLTTFQRAFERRYPEYKERRRRMRQLPNPT